MLQTNGKMEMDARVDKRVKQYVEVRDRIKKIKDYYEQEVAELEAVKQKLTTWLLNFLETTGQESARTSEGTVTASVRYSASLSDPEAFMTYVRENDLFELIDRKANEKACREHVEEHGTLPPGVRLNSLRYVGVRHG